MRLLPKQGRGPPLRPRENATYTDGFCECLGEAPSAAVCEQKALGAGQYKSFVYFEVGTAAGPRWERLCYGRTDRAFNPYPQPGTVSGFAVTVCRSEDDCELNGRCEAGRCRCDSGWKGDSCGQLDLLPAKAMPDNGYNRLHEKPAGYSSWGGSIIRDDESGLFHMFAAEMDKSCGINLWCGPLHNRSVAHPFLLAAFHSKSIAPGTQTRAAFARLPGRSKGLLSLPRWSSLPSATSRSCYASLRARCVLPH